MKKLLLVVSTAFVSMFCQAQSAFTIQEAVDYALKNHANVKNALVDIQDAEMQIKEIKVSGLPQINGQFSFTYNAIVPTQLVDAKNFNPQAAEGETVKFRFGVPWGGQAGIGVNQLIFNATWLVGLRAADTYRALASKNLENSKIGIAENVKKAYYSVLVSEERAGLLDLSISRLDSIIRDTKILNEQGFVEKIDIDRLQVQKNNLITEKIKIKNLIQLTYQLLKFQMAYDMNEKIVLKDKLNATDIDGLKLVKYQNVDANNRIEYSLLQTQRKLTELNMERYQKGYLPSVSFSGSLGAGHGNTVFNPFQRWFGSSALTLGVNIPIYDSGLKRVQIERQRLNIIKIDQSGELLKQSFQLQNDQSMISLQNGIESLESQKRNLDLATEVVRVSKVKYQQGVGSNLEVINAESDLKQAQTNFFAALYDVLIAKVDLDKAQGNLLKN